MRYLVVFICILALGAVGCSETAGTGGRAGDGGAAGMGGEGGAAGMGGAPVALRLFMSSFEPPLEAGPVEGLRICELETDNCVLTDAGGYATLEGSAGETALSMDGAGLGAYIYMHILRDDEVPLALGNATEARFEEMFGLVMSPYPMEGAGAIWVSGLPEGAMLTLVNGTGKPFYAEHDVKQSWNPNLSEATPRGGGGFVEVAPGDYQVAITGTSKTCVPARGWPGDSENTARMPVREGYLSSTRMKCD
jgi:hypothetical protein